MESRLTLAEDDFYVRLCKIGQYQHIGVGGGELAGFYTVFAVPNGENKPYTISLARDDFNAVVKHVRLHLSALENADCTSGRDIASLMERFSREWNKAIRDLDSWENYKPFQAAPEALPSVESPSHAEEPAARNDAPAYVLSGHG